MLFDWFTVVAQIINFLILLGLMKRFLYRPILQALDAREARIAADLADADAKQAAAAAERETYERKNMELDGQRDALLRQAESDAQAERQRLIEEARQAADTLRARHRDALRHEQRGLSHDIERLTREEVYALARTTLRDLADAELEGQMVRVFAERLQGLDAAALATLKTAMQSANEPVAVRGAFPLPDASRAVIDRAIEASLGKGINVVYETVPEVIGGIELVAGGRKLAWSIGDRLGALEQRVNELLAAPDRHDATATG